METEIRDMRRDLKKLMIDIALIKKTLLEKEELSDWAKQELGEARKTPEAECVPQEEVKELILQK
ncbi:hypothetical protein CMI37_08045 [Candidatus Pacearchaeota archaeon]|nr:hypothetical protein [Candidatus Pacearchaeota archaeon]|tara:strand:+ start:9638 stop:9832 length:195 start_codon:yes stop_codon:yes gene_type:complete